MNAFNDLLRELSGEDPRCFHNFIRMHVEDFNELLQEVTLAAESFHMLG